MVKELGVGWVSRVSFCVFFIWSSMDRDDAAGLWDKKGQLDERRKETQEVLR